MSVHQMLQLTEPHYVHQLFSVTCVHQFFPYRTSCEKKLRVLWEHAHTFTLFYLYSSTVRLIYPRYQGEQRRLAASVASIYHKYLIIVYVKIQTAKYFLRTLVVSEVNLIYPDCPGLVLTIRNFSCSFYSTMVSFLTICLPGIPFIHQHIPRRNLMPRFPVLTVKL